MTSLSWMSFESLLLVSSGVCFYFFVCVGEGRGERTRLQVYSFFTSFFVPGSGGFHTCNGLALYKSRQTRETWQHTVLPLTSNTVPRGGGGEEQDGISDKLTRFMTIRHHQVRTENIPSPGPANQAGGSPLTAPLGSTKTMVLNHLRRRVLPSKEKTYTRLLGVILHFFITPETNPDRAKEKKKKKGLSWLRCFTPLFLRGRANRALVYQLKGQKKKAGAHARVSDLGTRARKRGENKKGRSGCISSQTAFEENYAVNFVESDVISVVEEERDN